jgi:hypothetical protein
MSETPDSTPAKVPAETQAQQPELCFGEVETQNEMQIEMRFEAVETPAEARADKPSETQFDPQNETRFEIVGTQAETPNETPNAKRFETVGTQIETPVETRPERRTEPRLETWVDTRAETRAEMRDTRVETPLQAQAETPKETRVEAQAEARLEAQTEAQTETRAEIERIEAESEQPTEKRAATRPEPQAVTLNDRPFRVKLRGSVLVLIRLPNKRQLRAALHQLSTSGGVINLEKPLDEKIEVELIFHIDRSTIRGKAQMLFPMWATQGWMQPFRFVELTDTDRNALQENLQSFIGNLAKGASTAG